MKLELVERPPTVDEYQALRKAVGWAEVDRQTVERGLRDALFSVCLLRDGEVIGCGRVVGDGAIYLYVQDVIVLPEYQGRRLGIRIMDAIMGFVGQRASGNTFVGLMAADDVSGFYERYGFAKRPPNRPGMFQMWRAGRA